jgi:hypothetical protein
VVDFRDVYVSMLEDVLGIEAGKVLNNWTTKLNLISAASWFSALGARPTDYVVDRGDHLLSGCTGAKDRRDTRCLHRF